MKIKDSIDIWLVSWNARNGKSENDIKIVGKPFLKKEEAKQFVDTLIAAKETLQYTEDINIKIEKLN